MNQIASTFLGKLKARLIPLLDISAWVLLITSVWPGACGMMSMNASVCSSS